jgi:small neutral amino acid transporter SnatA (MarC family)
MTFHSLLYTFISSILALFPVMNILGNGFVVNAALGDLDEPSRRKAIKTIIRNCLAVGVSSLLAGQLILWLFGLAIPVIQVAGGIIICRTGLGWLKDSPTIKTTEQQLDLDSIEGRLFYPISFPICLGPGSISVIFTLMATASVKGEFLHTAVNYGMIILGIGAMVTGLYFSLLYGKKVLERLGESGNLIIGKLLAFITFCIGIQIVVTGVSKIFHLNIL